MIGTNFRTASDIHLQRFQKVFTTHNGREVGGYIQRYQGDEVLIRIPGNIEGKEIISRKPDQIRLLDSRKTQKLQTSNPMEYRKMSEESNLRKCRTVSASIEVPQPGPRVRRTSEEPTMTELMAAMVLSSLSSSPVFHNPDNLKASSLQSFGSSDMGSWSQDSRHTSPSRQPPSVGTPQRSTHMRASPHIDPRERIFKEQERAPRSSTPEDVLDAESGTILLQRSTPTPTKATLGDKSKDMEISDEPQDLRVPKVHVEHILSPRPASHSSQASSSYSEPGRLEVVMEKEETCPKIEQGVSIPMAMPLALTPQIPLPYYFAPGLFQQPFPASLPAEFRFQLAGTPPRRSRSPEVGSSAPGYIDSKMHRHLHRAVPYKKNEDASVPSPSGGSSPSTLSFGSAPSSYYNFPNPPVPVASLSFSPSHHGKHSRSPLASKTSPYTSPAANIHSNPISVPSNPPRYSILRDSPYPNAMHGQSVNAPNTKAFSWHSGASASFVPKPVVQQRQPLQQTSSTKATFPMSPKSVAMGRKVRGDGKKCRKVYGMENRDLWCTACKWKKACQRFPD